ncbi:MAG: hypothetical protein GY915_03220 [bacterium]|nr:hypothetical protein [bacterium]
MKKTDMAQLRKSLDGVEDRYPDVLIGERLFVRGKGDHREILVLAYQDSGGALWGHVLRKGDVWVSCLVGLTAWFNGGKEEELFENFLWQVEKLGKWSPVESSSGSGEETLRKSDSFKGAVANLSEMLDILDVDVVLGEGEVSKTSKVDYRLLDVFSFGGCMEFLEEEGIEGGLLKMEGRVSIQEEKRGHYEKSSDRGSRRTDQCWGVDPPLWKKLFRPWNSFGLPSLFPACFSLWCFQHLGFETISSF